MPSYGSELVLSSPAIAAGNINLASIDFIKGAFKVMPSFSASAQDVALWEDKQVIYFSDSQSLYQAEIIPANPPTTFFDTIVWNPFSFESSSFVSASFNTSNNILTFHGPLTSGSITSSLAVDLSSLAGGGGSGIFVQTGSFYATTNNLQISGSLTITGSSPSINIGTPEGSDNVYTDGYFSTFNENTRLANAIDQISEAFADLAPAKAGQLTSTSLVRSTPATVYSGYLAGGLFADDWYIGFTANQLVSNKLAISTGVSLTSPSPSTSFRAGKKSDFTPSNVLEGGVTASVTAQSDAASLSIKALNTGTGIVSALNITDLSIYESLWMKANATISHTMADTGSYKYKLSADNDAGETAETQLFYLGSGADYPDPSVSVGTIISGSTTYNDLSGIKYLKTADFTIPSTGSNLFNPVYNINQFTFSSTYFTNETTGSQASDTPQYSDTLELGIVRSLTAGLSSAQSAPTGTVAVIKPGKTGTYNASYTLTPQLVNSYVSDPSTTINEPFLGESRRYTNLNNAGWTSANALTNGNLEVQNGRLIGGNQGNYSGFTGTQNYYRLFSGYTNGLTGGTFNFTATGFTALNAWDSGLTGIEAAIIIQEDVTGNTTASKIFDLGRAQQNGAVSGNIYGTKIGDVGPLSGDWSFGTNATVGASGNLIIWIRFSSPDLTSTLTNLNLTVS